MALLANVRKRLLPSHVGDQHEMRRTFIETLVKISENDPRVMLLTADLGYTVIEPFAQKYKSRFVNVGVDEQNLIGLATGLAEAGFIPFVYSIVPFAILRPYEFIRNGPIIHHLPVRIVGTGGGFDYGSNGLTHYGLEDLGVLRIQPGITIIAPADYAQARSSLLRSWDLSGPIYYRLGKDDTTIIPGLNGQFEIGRTQQLNTGDDILIISTGSVAIETVNAVKILSKHGVSCSLLIAACLNPVPKADLIDALSKHHLVLTVEAHYVVGGLGSLISEVIAENALPCRLVRCGVRTTPTGITGSNDYMLRLNGLKDEQIATKVLEEIQ
jgi:transketolase